jgi:hypothetical protein
MSAMADLNQKHFADDEKAAQQVHPRKPPRDDGGADGDPNETPPGRPQHEATDPDEQEW